MIYRTHSLPLNQAFKLSPAFDGFLTRYANDILQKAGRTARVDTINNLKNALGVILGNLLRLSVIHPESALQIDLSNDGYPKGPFNPHRLNPRSVRSVVVYLTQHRPQLIQKSGGNYDRTSKIGYPTRIMPTKHLTDKIWLFYEQLPNDNINHKPSAIYTETITRNTFFNHIDKGNYTKLFVL